MKTNRLWWSLLVALMLPLSFALTACDDDNDGGSGSNKLNKTAWYGEDNSGNYYNFDFHEDGFWASREGTGIGCEGDYTVSSDKIRFSNVDNYGSETLIRDGSYEYKLSGRRGDRTLVIYDVLNGRDELYLEEINYEGSGSGYGSDDDWSYDW
ncbi:MAG: hypothetical protein K2G30_05055 [Muribaculaceae bacterium]|nr:hypothetical protein [Muribaculaceae bacterium]MDE7142300.1 hypothetical protein [Muribaculaceae bacterium]